MSLKKARTGNWILNGIYLICMAQLSNSVLKLLDRRPPASFSTVNSFVPHFTSQNLFLPLHVDFQTSGCNKKEIWLVQCNSYIMRKVCYQERKTFFELGLFWYLAQSQILGNSLGQRTLGQYICYYEAVQLA